jgi:hypothetical protein
METEKNPTKKLWPLSCRKLKSEHKNKKQGGKRKKGTPWEHFRSYIYTGA